MTGDGMVELRIAEEVMLVLSSESLARLGATWRFSSASESLEETADLELFPKLEPSLSPPAVWEALGWLPGGLSKASQRAAVVATLVALGMIFQRYSVSQRNKAGKGFREG